MTTTPEGNGEARKKIDSLVHQTARKLGIYIPSLQEIPYRWASAQPPPGVDMYEVAVHTLLEQGTLSLRVTYHHSERRWKASVLSWTTPPRGVYYIKEFATNTAEAAWPRLPLYSTSEARRGVSIGHASLVGKTAEGIPRPVYHLYDCAPTDGADGRRRVEGNFVLEKRRLNLLPASIQVRWRDGELMRGPRAGDVPAEHSPTAQGL